jgi:glycosyltransferase involved in cell wall biosynthesis
VVKNIPAMISEMVSTIIPVYNRPELLLEAVNSVLNQSYRPIEIIIVDDGSTDNTPDNALRMAKSHSEVRYVRRINGGPGCARESGREVVRGEFVQHLDSDDILMPQKFEIQVAALRQNRKCGIAYGKTRFYQHGEKQTDIPWKRTGECIPTLFPSMLMYRWWGTSTPLYRRSLLDRAGSWSELWSEEDWEYDCRIAKQGVKLVFCDFFLSDEREHSGDRLSRASYDPRMLSHRAKAHALIYEHATAAGIKTDDKEMCHFARELFLLCRQCGNSGLENEAEQLFHLAKMASGKERASRMDFVIYGWLSKLLGWHFPGKLTCLIDGLREK